jgi:hypothetical protein
MDVNFVEERPPLTPDSLPSLVWLRFASCLPRDLFDGGEGNWNPSRVSYV